MRSKLTFILIIVAIFNINANNRISSNLGFVENRLLSSVLVQLGLTENDIDKKLYVEKVLPSEKLYTVMVISKFSQRDEYYTSYDAYVLVVNNKTAEIANKFVEKNAWISDKVKVSKIVIDTAPYILSKGNRAFGIRVEFGNRSKASLYDMTELSLFVKEKKTLSCVLKKYPILKYNGEMIFGCIQYSKGVEAVMSIGKEVSKSIRKKARRKISKSIITDKTNTFSDIFMKEKITIIENKGVNYDCEEKEKTESRIIRLSYNGKEYVPL